MNFFLHSIICLMLVLFQVTIKNVFPVFNGFYDLSIPYICYLSIHQPVLGNVIIVILLGFTMDSLSGGPFGIYMTTYIWYLTGIRIVSGMFNITNIYIMSVSMAAGVVFENLICYGSYVLNGTIPYGKAEMILQQILWAFFTGIILYKILEFVSTRYTMWIDELTDKWNRRFDL